MIPLFQNGKIWIKHLNIGATIPLEQELSLYFVLNSTLIGQVSTLFPTGNAKKRFLWHIRILKTLDSFFSFIA
jgi:hypothetical protein